MRTKNWAPPEVGGKILTVRANQQCNKRSLFYRLRYYDGLITTRENVSVRDKQGRNTFERN